MRRTVLVLAVAAVAVAFYAERPAATPGPALRDFESYYAAGVTWGYHTDPYGRDVWRTERTIPGVVASRDELLPFVGPPFGLPLWHLAGGLPWNAATVVWEAVLALAIATIALGSLRLAGGRIDAIDAIAVFVAIAGFGPITSGVALGQIAIVAVAAIVLVPFLLGPRLVLAAAAAALVAALQPNLAVVLGALLGTRRSGIALVFAAVVAIGGSMLALGGPAGILRYADVLRAQLAAERFIAIQTTPEAVARAFGLSPSIAAILGSTIALVVAAGVIAQWLSRRYAPADRLALACAALPLTLTFAHEHDFAIVFFPALAAVRRASGALWVAAAIGLLGAGTDWLGLAQRPTGIAETATLTLAASLALVSLARDRLRPYHVIPLGAAVLVALAGAAAATHPLPTWPDALGFDFHERFFVPAPAVWHDEQMRSGIGALVPAWGALRLASLASCALVWLVASVVLRTPVTATALPSSAMTATRSRRPAAAYPSD